MRSILPHAIAPVAALLAALLALPCRALQLEESLQWQPAATAAVIEDEQQQPQPAKAFEAEGFEAEAFEAEVAEAPVSETLVSEALASAARGAEAGAVDTDRNAITDFVRASLGAPYRMGASGGREGFDCSGLVLRAYAAAGLAVPRVSSQQIATGNAVPLQALKAGDLLFYRMRASAPRQLHVAVYVGAGRAIHASVTHKVVREIDITRPLWSQRLVAARSLL